MDMTSVNSKRIRKYVCTALRILCVLLIIGAVVDQLYSFDKFENNPYKWSEGGSFKIPYRQTFFHILCAVILLFRQRMIGITPIKIGAMSNRLVPGMFWWIKFLSLTAALTFWIHGAAEQYQMYLNGSDAIRNMLRYCEAASWYTAKYFGPWIVLVYVVEWWFRFCVRLRYLWNSDRAALRNPLNIISAGSEYEMTKARQYFCWMEAGFLLYAALVFWIMHSFLLDSGWWWQSAIRVEFATQAGGSNNLLEQFLDMLLYAPYNHLWLYAPMQVIKYGFLEKEYE